MKMLVSATTRIISACRAGIDGQCQTAVGRFGCRRECFGHIDAADQAVGGAPDLWL
jgi:hypothetical protein